MRTSGSQWDLRTSYTDRLSNQILWGWLLERGNKSPYNQHGEEAQGSLSWTPRAFMPLDGGPHAASWCCLYLAPNGYLLWAVILLSTCLCHFPNQIRNGPCLGPCLNPPITVLSAYAQHLKIRFLRPHNCEYWILWTRYWEECLRKGSSCYFCMWEALKRHSLDANLW